MTLQEIEAAIDQLHSAMLPHLEAAKLNRYETGDFNALEEVTVDIWRAGLRLRKLIQEQVPA